ncbi:MAG TPA: xanthine dehydrogenase family protein subunit M [Nocardioidaceae bacterium]|nr:xanthine dehydrogenase family protein subunit M [Nocardioidaceae bacterium]
MRAPAFLRPTTVEEASRLLAQDPDEAKVLSGGTAVVLMMKQGLIAPSLLVSLAGVDGLGDIARVRGALRIGAGVCLAQIAASAEVRRDAPSLAHACSEVGNPRVRNVATLGGNLAEGDYASDPPAVLASLGARCHLSGPAGSRTVPVDGFVTGFFQTVLEDAEIITHIDVPVVADRGTVYLKYRSRSSEDRACVGVAARADFAGDRVAALDVHVAAVAATPQSVPAACELATGERLSPELVRRVARGYAEAIDPIDDARGSAWYRTRMIEVTVERALNELGAGRSQEVDHDGN